MALDDLGLYPRQMLALQSRATEILFGGASEGGKSVFARYLTIILASAIPNLQVFLGRKFRDDVISNHMEGALGYRALLADWQRSGRAKVTEDNVRFLDNGSLITMFWISEDSDLEKHQGKEKHLLVIDEATQYKERWIRFLRAWVRMPADMKDTLPKYLKPLFPWMSDEEAREYLPKILYTANPIGESVGYFRRQFVKSRAAFTIERAAREEGGFLQQYIPSRRENNPSVDASAHDTRLAGLGDPAIAKALREGDWDAPVGEFFPEWDERRHVIQHFDPPDWWYRFRAFDWGTADPFAVYWIAVSDGEAKGGAPWLPRGSLFFYKEWYGCDDTDPAKGNRYRNEDIAIGIRGRTRDTSKQPTVTDSLPFQDRGGKTIADVFTEIGVPLTLGDTSRVPGWSQVRSRLIGIVVDTNERDEYGAPKRYPTIYFSERCHYAREYLPALPRHPNDKKREDAAEHGEATHCCDAIRLACMASPLVIAEPIKEGYFDINKENRTYDAVIEAMMDRKHSQTDSW